MRKGQAKFITAGLEVETGLTDSRNLYAVHLQTSVQCTFHVSTYHISSLVLVILNRSHFLIMDLTFP
jgi:hypothetical protein